MPRFKFQFWAVAAMMASVTPASAQFFSMANPGCSSCQANSAPYIQPMYQPTAYSGGCSTCNAGAPVMNTGCSTCNTGCEIVHAPIMQTCYQTVPVTEYQQVKQMVKRAIPEVKYVEQPVTEYQPVTETRTAQVPTVSYQDQTEYRTQTRNMGYWVTKYNANPKCSPCSVDSRPGFAGWWGRTTYSMKSALTPAYTAQREYVCRTCVQTVPVTRRVAIQGTREVAYNVTTMVPRQTMRKVAINTVRYVDEEVTVNRPVTVMRTVPIGSQMAFAPGMTGTAFLPGPFGGPQTALGPTPIAEPGVPIPPRSASRDNLERANPERPRPDGGLPASKISFPKTEPTPIQPTLIHSIPTALHQQEPRIVPRKSSSSVQPDLPSVIRGSQMVARVPITDPPSATGSSAISVADTAR